MSNPHLQSIKNQLNLGHLTLDQNAIGSALANQLQQAFSGEILQLEGVKQPITETDDSLHFQARIPSLLGVRLQAVEGIFFVYNGQLEYLLKATLPKVWDFSWSYPDLPDYTNFGNLDPDAGNQPSLFYDLRFPSDKPMVLVFSSHNFQKDQTPKSYLTLLDTTLNISKIHQGLNFVSEIALSEMPLLHTLIEFAGYKDSSLPFYGYINQQPEYEEIRLEIELNFTKTYENIFSFGISSLVLHTSISLYANYIGSGISFLGGVTIGTSKTPKNVEIVWPVGSTQLIIENAEPIPFPGFDTFTNLLSGHLPNNSDTFPLEINSLSTLEIRELSLHLSLSPLKVSYIVLSIGTTANWNQPLLGKALTIESLLLRWEVSPGDPTPIRFYLLSAWKVGGGLVNASAVFPDFAFYGELGLYQTIALDQIIEEIIPNAHLPHISILDLAISADIKQGLYAFEIEMASDWELNLGGTSILPLKYLHLEIEKNLGGSFATINSVLTIAGVDIILLATNANESGGWTFAGSTRPGQQIPIGLLIKDLVMTFGIKDGGFPKAIEGLVVENIATYFNTETKNFYFTCESILEIEEEIIDVILQINIIQQLDGSYKKHFDGHITIGSLKFALIFETDKTSTNFLAAYHDEKTVKIKDLIGYLDPQLKDEIPEGLEISLKDALFVYAKQQSLTNFLFGLNIGGGINLSNLPLIGQEFPPNETLKISLQVLVTKANFTATELQTFNTLYPDGGIKLPTTEIKQRLDLTPSIQLGSEIQQLQLPIAINKNTGQIQDTGSSSNNTNSVVTPSATPTPIDDGTKWFQMQKAFGPVHFQRVGIKYQYSKIWVLLDAGLSLAGLSLSLDGLGVNSPLNQFDPKFDLKGIGIDYKGSDTLEIGGAFLRTQVTKDGKTYDEYDGAAVIKFKAKGKDLTLSAIGSYAYVDGHPSLFIYALLDYPIGGPSFFFVTGLAAGFGYNRALKVPTIDQVATFPLVAEAISPPPAEGSNLDKAARLTEELNKLRDYIPPETGQIFLAIGVKFNSFKTIDAFVLLTVAFGNRFELNILGLATLIAPPNPGPGVSPVAEVQLALKASFLPAEGFLGIIAQLTPNSYILSKACHLTGGFAFYTWFAPNEHDGDFVLTLGGYHPLFKVPDHYPKVPRLGLNWQVSPELFLKADAYFALTPSAIMAGGHLQATWNSGPLSAWFNAGADFLMSWKPYHYGIPIYVDMGVSYTFQSFGTQHITVQLGADLHIWGPEFTGIAHIHLWIISFDVRFGSSASQEPTAIKWEEFKPSFLPANDAICSIAVKDGLVRKVNEDDKTDLGIINPNDFCLVTNSVIPIKTCHVNLNTQGINTKFGIGPMAVTASELTSELTISINKNGTTLNSTEFDEDFACIPLFKKVPIALWGESLTPSLNGNQFIENTLSGLEIKPKKQPKPGATQAINRRELQFSPVSIDNAYHWQTIGTFQEETTKDISSTIVDNTVKNTRDNLLKALNLNSEEINLSKTIADHFLGQPKIEVLAN
ncbi:hypothetical protein H6F92_10870 [Microcystis wesenbergii FACHB-1317]|uniref:DUF6603 domain-containing protein n=1 Tax=Microcystis TaxID=1125 RepID=UPI001680B93C|nr:MULTISPECIES: DUF6603 domain-containing protein [Microcystis]MBD2289267.1 hypothetical protein [Microcystis wesenbergii FACHB-1317]UZO77724.1 hypothetical protein M8120_07280 [Microcystis aeruginosa str. Chao 1910]